jgi:hypothetical protein
VTHNDKYNIPILKSLWAAQIFKVLRLIFIIFGSSYFVGVIWLIYSCDVLPQPVINMIPDPLNSSQLIYDITDENANFCQMYFKDNTTTKGDKLVKIWYFGITTLSTVGYGDLYPRSP